MHHNGRALCTYLNFLENGGACNHLGAMQTVVNHTLSHTHAPPLVFPTSVSEALSIFPSALALTDLPLPFVNMFSKIQASSHDHTLLDLEEDSEPEEDNGNITGDLEDAAYKVLEPPPNLNQEQWRSINAQIEAEFSTKCPRSSLVYMA
ncbi:hypothetical protein PM082_014399 [Marasmius tenuissimus]|nr:hypothetical protein PM082_014399 [Marasmius tenuissimus]